MKRRIGIILALVLVCIAASALAGMQVTDAETFPDENFRRFLKTLDEDGDGWIIPWGIKEMNCSGYEIADLSGICNFSDLEKLNCSNNKLKTVFTENLEKLKTLDCSGNAISSLDITKNTALRTLDCSGNPLASLDLTQSPGLKSLNAGGTNITALSVIKGSNLAKAAAAEPQAYGKTDNLWKDAESGCWIIANRNTAFTFVDGGQSGEGEESGAEYTVGTGSIGMKAGNFSTNRKDTGELFARSSDPSVLSVESINVVLKMDAPTKVYFNFIVTFRGVSPGTATISVYDGTYQTTCHWTLTVKVVGEDPPEPPPALNYEVTVTSSGNGTAAADPVSGPEGTEVRLTATPDNGYRLKEWQVLAGGVTVTDSKFTIGTSDVIVNAVFEKIPADLSKAKITVSDQVYTGKALTPKVKVEIDGKTLASGTDYTAAYSNNKEIGKATVTVTGAGEYTGAASASFAILPKKTASASLKAGSRSLTLKWKAGKGIDGYEIEYGLKKDFKGAKKITVKKAKTTEYEITKLKAKKTYYVRIRAWKKVKGKKYYSEWSKTLSKKTK